MSREEYCREIEAYLCRKNDGHLIRIVGPSFERVCGWADQGIPFKVACQGIDRYFVRYYIKGPRRRPVHIDFCEADVLDAFDAWRRAVGLRASDEGDDEKEQPKHRRGSLPEHLDRLRERLTSRRAEMIELPARFESVLEAISLEIDAFTQLPSPIRGEARARVTARLSDLDRLMIDAARAQCDAPALQSLREEAAEQLRPFRDRMPPDAYERAIDAAVDRLIRERERLPVVAWE